MENKSLCQSCSMPLDSPALLGTEKDGNKSQEYCKYCYQDGVFINAGMTLDEMRTVVKTQMEKRKIDTAIINQAVAVLPALKRWKSEKVLH
ncbi:MAG: zinc ribbon domain-containing protein [Chitinophagales bacterium]